MPYWLHKQEQTEMASVLNQKYFHDEAAAFAAMEAIMWPEGPTCPHCGACDRINRLQGVKDRKGNARPGLWKCYHCRKQFTVRKGTVFEVQPFETSPVVPSRFPNVFQQEGRVGKPASPDFGRHT